MFLFTAGDLVKRWLRDVNVAALHQFEHLTAEEGEQKRSDVRAVHVRICHDDDFVVADLLDVEGTFLVTITNTGTNGGDHGLDLLVLKHLVEAGFLHVDQFTADRENRLGASITTLLGRATGGITLNNVEFGFRRIAG